MIEKLKNGNEKGGEVSPEKNDCESARVRFPDDPYQTVTNGLTIKSIVRNYWLRVQKYAIILNIITQNFTQELHQTEKQQKAGAWNKLEKKLKRVLFVRIKKYYLCALFETPRWRNW